MLTATLGGLIKDYRIKKRLSQQEVSVRIGWKDTSRISKIEQGRVGKPTRETAEKIIKALELNESEKGNFLFVGGYLPNEEEIKKVIKDVKLKIDTWPYTAYLMDFSYRWLYSNLNTLKMIMMPFDQKKWVEKAKPNLLEFAFLPKEHLQIELMKGEDADSLKPLKIAQIASFKTENEVYQNESWYKNVINNLMKYEDFREMWPQVDQSMYHKKLFDYEYKRVIGNYDGKTKTLDFHILTAIVIKDPRFLLLLYFPASDEARKFFTS